VLASNFIAGGSLSDGTLNGNAGPGHDQGRTACLQMFGTEAFAFRRRRIDKSSCGNGRPGRPGNTIPPDPSINDSIVVADHIVVDDSRLSMQGEAMAARDKMAMRITISKTANRQK